MCVMDVLEGVHLASHFCMRANLPSMGRCHVSLFVLVPEYITGGSCQYRNKRFFVAILLSTCIEGCLLSIINFSSSILRNRVKSMQKCGEGNGARILPAGKISRDAMRLQKRSNSTFATPTHLCLCFIPDHLVCSY